MSFDQELHGCFTGSGYFATHPADEDRAFEWLKKLRATGIGWKRAKGQIGEYLKAKGFDQEHIEQETERARKKLKPWLID
jgi:hypothetical protein